MPPRACDLSAYKTKLTEIGKNVQQTKREESERMRKVRAVNFVDSK